jgi:hypothetical protein
MLGFGVPLLALGTGGLIASFSNPDVGWLFFLPSVAAFVPGAILTSVGSVRVARGVRERRAVESFYVFAPNRDTLGVGAMAHF